MTAGSSSAGERLGEHLERADRRLELVAHVGDEVAAHALDPVHLGDVVDERGRAERPLGVAERHRRQVQHRARRAEELQLALARARRCSARVEQLVERAGGDRVGVARVAVPLGRRVAEHLAAVGVDDDDRRGGARRARPASRSRSADGGVGRRSSARGERLLRARRRLVASLRAHGLSRTAR